MEKLLVLFVCALGAVGAGRIPPSENDINYKLVMGNRRPLFFDPFNPLRVFQYRNQETLNRQRIDQDEQQEQLQLQDEDDDRVGYEQEARYNRVPLSRNIDDLPTVSQDSSRLLYVGRRRQQQNQERREDQDVGQQSSTRRQGIYGDIYREQGERGDFFGGERRGFFDRRQQEENVGPRRFSRIGEGRRVGDVDSVTEQDILRFIRLDNRLGEFSDEQIVEILRRQREQQAEARRVGQGVEQEREQVRAELPTARRDDDRLVYINRRRLDQSRADLIPRRIVRIGEGRRVDEEQLGYNRFDQRYNEQSIQSQRERVQQRERVREQEEQRERVRQEQEQEQRERVRQQEQQVREQQQQRDRVREQQQQQLERVREVQQQRERVREQQQQEENVRVLQQRENERERVRVQQQRENVREQQQERVRVQQQRENERERVQERGDDDDVQRLSDSLPSVRRDDKRLVYINRRRQGENVVVGRRVDRIGEGRRVGDVDPVSEQDILQFIRRDNRLSYLSDDEVVEMLRRNRERQQQAGVRRVGQQEGEEEQVDREQGEGLQTVRRDDDRLVYVNRRRLGKGVN